MLRVIFSMVTVFVLELFVRFTLTLVAVFFTVAFADGAAFFGATGRATIVAADGFLTMLVEVIGFLVSAFLAGAALVAPALALEAGFLAVAMADSDNRCDYNDEQVLNGSGGRMKEFGWVTGRSLYQTRRLAFSRNLTKTSRECSMLLFKPKVSECWVVGVYIKN